MLEEGKLYPYRVVEEKYKGEAFKYINLYLVCVNKRYMIKKKASRCIPHLAG